MPKQEKDKIKPEMKELFEKIYSVVVRESYEALEGLWDKHAAEWIREISGDVVGNVEGVPYSDYNEFANLSGEEQYAFYAWCMKRGLKWSGK